jgi:hypothetical protein
MTPSQEVTDAVQNFIPIGLQGLMRNPADATNADQLVKAGGATVYKYRTEAENLAQRKASDHMPRVQSIHRNFRSTRGTSCSKTGFAPAKYREELSVVFSGSR